MTNYDIDIRNVSEERLTEFLILALQEGSREIWFTKCEEAPTEPDKAYTQPEEPFKKFTVISS